MNKVTLKLAMSAFTLLLCFGLVAQQGGRKERQAKILEKKMDYCNEQVGLSESEAEKYWAIDAELMVEKKAIQKELKDVRDIDLDSASDAEIESAIKKGYGAKVTVAELELSYVDRFLEALSPKQLALMKKAERNFKKEMLRELKESGRPGGMRK